VVQQSVTNTQYPILGIGYWVLDVENIPPDINLLIRTEPADQSTQDSLIENQKLLEWFE